MKTESYVERKNESMNTLTAEDLASVVSAFSETNPVLEGNKKVIYEEIGTAIKKQKTVSSEDTANRTFSIGRSPVIGNSDRKILNADPTNHIQVAYNKSKEFLPEEMTFESFKNLFNKCFLNAAMRPAA